MFSCLYINVLPYFIIAAGIPIATTSIAIAKIVDAIRYNSKSPAPRYLPKATVITKPRGRVTTDAKKVMLTSKANFLDGCMINPSLQKDL